MNLQQLNTFKNKILDGSLEICKGNVTPTQIYELANKALEEALTIPLVGSSTFFKVTFAYDKSKQGRSVWRYEEKVFEVNTADELDSKIKDYIRECTTRLVDRWYYMQKTKVERM